MLNIKFETCRLILESLNPLSIRTCHSWVLTIIDEDDPCVILRDGRGCYKRKTFYENYPELEIEAKAFALNEASKKTCNFNAYFFAQFVDKTFREIYSDDVIYFANDSNVFIRSVESCRADLLNINCVDQNGVYIGLLDISKKLGLIDNSSSSKDFLLKELREMLLTHPAFDGVNTHLEKLAAEYNIKIIWCPKYHCELNPIEGV
ncbi:unnamed protein product [Brachionus calyciflorus]|uniref:Uncharacterized protein n=1 Tax=Brachionus calyciflorus TaxID=104777 RepID=A0A813UJ43_9BILA|nr:unnamed protein product [Brachionus calyciflorus]